MPIYEYRCANGHNFEVLQRMSDDPILVCEVCGEPVQRVFHPVAVHFKGSGFYATDYGRSGQGGGGSKDDGAGSSSESSSDSKSETAASKSDSSSSDSASSSSSSSSSSGSGDSQGGSSKSD